MRDTKPMVEENRGSSYLSLLEDVHVLPATTVEHLVDHSMCNNNNNNTLNLDTLSREETMFKVVQRVH